MGRAEAYKATIDAALETYFGPEKRGLPFDGLLESMHYSLTAGGKRIRPMLVLEFCRVCGGDVKKALPVACAVEMLHTYSLIHDDLPCMDNDSLRRGKPTNHVVYGECTATLAGDALQAEAFGTILRSELTAERRAACAEALADAAGVDGICGGQFMDMGAENRALSEEELSDLQARKTGALLVGACRMGVLAAGGTPEQEEAAGRFGAALGAAFQIRDDMLDELASEEELGKPIGSDKGSGKSTFMTLYGEAKCREMVEKLSAYAESCLDVFEDTAFLRKLTEELEERKN